MRRLAPVFLALAFLWPQPAFADQGGELLAAAKMGDRAEVERLIAAGVDIETEDWAGWTPLAWASLRLRDDVIRILAEAGAKINIIARSGKNSGTPLMLAARRKNAISTVRLLLDLGAEVDGADQYGRTALMLAARQGEVENIFLLLEAGANPNAVADLPKGNTALRLARRGGHGEAIRVLMYAGANQ